MKTVTKTKTSLKQKLKKYISKKLDIFVKEKLKNQEYQIRELQIALIGATSDQFKAESLYIQKNGLTVFPYQQVKEMPPVEGGIDEALKLPYVIHKGKKLYFPRSYSVNQCVAMYESYIGEECLLGGKFRGKRLRSYVLTYH